MNKPHADDCVCETCCLVRAFQARIPQLESEVMAALEERGKNNGNDPLTTLSAETLGRAALPCAERPAEEMKQYDRCLHLGDQVVARLLVELGIHPARVRRRCHENHGTPPGIVCPCQDCGPRCPDYKSIDDYSLDLGS